MHFAFRHSLLYQYYLSCFNPVSFEVKLLAHGSCLDDISDCVLVSPYCMYYFFCCEWLAWVIEMRDLWRWARKNCANPCISSFNLSLLCLS